MTNAERYLALTALTFAAMVAYGPAVYGFTLFLLPLESEFGWSRGAVAGALSIFWIGAPLSPLIGRWIDRYGARLFIMVGIVIEGLAFMAFIWVDDIVSLYVLRATMGIGKITIVNAIAVSIPMWFDKRMGLAFGVTMAGLHGAGVLVVPLVGFLLSEYEWRVAAAIIGGGTIVVGIVPVALWIKKPAEPLEAKTSSGEQGNRPKVSAESSGFSFKEATTSIYFWVFVLLTVIYFSAFSGVLAHLVPYLDNLGFSSEFTGGVISTVAGAAAISVLVWGVLMDRFPHNPILLLLFALMFIVMSMTIGLSAVQSVFMASALAIVFGFTIGCDPVWMAALSKMYGQKDFGAIYGFWYSILLIQITVAPFLIGFVYDSTGSYSAAWTILQVLLVVGMLVIIAQWLYHAKLDKQSAPG